MRVCLFRLVTLLCDLHFSVVIRELEVRGLLAVHLSLIVVKTVTAFLVITAQSAFKITFG